MLHFHLVISLVILIDTASTDLMNSLGLLKQQIEKLGEEKFKGIFDEDNLNKQYNRLHNANAYKLMPINETKIAERFSKQLEDELRKKMDALKKTVEFAEDQAKNYKWNPNILPSDVSYINSKKLESNDSSLVFHPLFKSRIVANKSSVHIPTEIYDGDSTILNTIKWTESLDKAFVDNVNVLRYQYFASTTGIVVHFPGMMWRNKDLDMYDVRRRPWFAQGSSSPKDIMILLDTSGSMTGLSIAITRIAARKLIDTMGENDYLAVAQFPGNEKENSTHRQIPPHFLMSPVDKDNFKPCFKKFVQANKRNKEKYFEQISQIKALGIADLTDALKFAINEFRKMENNSRSYEGTNCNRIILVLTDGNDEHKEDEIKELMNESNLTKNIRIFIYSIGEEIAPKDALQRITCDYRGFFGHIRSYGAVNNIIDKYISVVHRHNIHDSNPLGDNEFRAFVSNVAPDEFLDHNDFPPKGLGLMTSLTMPVYNRSGNGTFLGLLGTDMTVDFMNYLVPHDELGPNGYAFAMNTNGYIIFHPELKVQRGWMRDPPNVDLIELEFNSDDKTKIRTDIINCAGSNGTSGGDMNVKSLIKVVDEIHTYEKVRKYAYHGIPLSTFGLTIVNPMFNKYYAEIDPKIQFDKLGKCDNVQCVMNVTLQDGKKHAIKFSKDVYILVESGLLERCRVQEEESLQTVMSTEALLYTSSTLMQNSSSQILPISTFGSTISASITMTGNLSLRPTGLNQNESMSGNQTVAAVPSIFSKELHNLLKRVEVNVANNCPVNEIRRMVLDLIILENFVNSLDLMTLKKSIKSIVIAMVSGITLVYPESEKYVYQDMFQSSWNSAIFQRAFDMDKFIFYTPLVRQGSSSHNDVMIFKAYSAVHSEKHTIPGAVLGITINQSSVIETLRLSDACNNGRVCYLLEDGGYIVSVSDLALVREVGSFFGDIEAVIMRTLINNSVFLEIEEFDYQASCPRPKNTDSTSSSSRVLQVLTALPLKVLQMLLNSVTTMISIIKLTLQLLLISQSHAQEATAANNENVSCIKKTYRYYFPESSDPTKVLDLSCDGCNSTVLTQRLENSNLLLVTFDRNCSIQCRLMNVKPVPSIPLQDLGPDVCAQALEPNYRMRPKYKCYSFDPNEDLVRCTGTIVSPPLIHAVLSVSIMLLKCLYVD